MSLNIGRMCSLKLVGRFNSVPPSGFAERSVGLIGRGDFVSSLRHADDTALRIVVYADAVNVIAWFERRAGVAPEIPREGAAAGPRVLLNEGASDVHREPIPDV